MGLKKGRIYMKSCKFESAFGHHKCIQIKVGLNQKIKTPRPQNTTPAGPCFTES